MVGRPYGYCGTLQGAAILQLGCRVLVWLDSFGCRNYRNQGTKPILHAQEKLDKYPLQRFPPDIKRGTSGVFHGEKISRNLLRLIKTLVFI